MPAAGRRVAGGAGTSGGGTLVPAVPFWRAALPTAASSSSSTHAPKKSDA